MAVVQPFKRIVLEDYDKQYRDLVDKLGSAINLFNDDVYNAFDNGLDIEDNFTSVKKSLTVMVDSTGKPTTVTQLKTGLPSICYGIQVLNAVNQTTTTTYPTGTPFLSFTENSGILTINNITGLQANNKYVLSLILIP